MSRPLLLFICSLGLMPAQAQRQESAAGMIAAQADLLNGIHAKGMKAGDSFFIRTDADWQQGGCTVRAKTLITGEVAKVEAQPHHVEWALKFNKIPCQGSTVEFRQPLLIALQAVHIVHTSALSRLSTAGFEDQTIASLFSPPRPGQASATVAGSGVTPGSIYAGFEPEAGMNTGEVRGLRGTTMQLPTGGVATTLVSYEVRYFHRSIRNVRSDAAAGTAPRSGGRGCRGG